MPTTPQLPHVTYGVLTAGHVIDHLLSKAKVGLVRFDHAGALQQQTIEISNVDAVRIYSQRNVGYGQDLGFLVLPELNASNLKATNTFYGPEEGWHQDC